MKSKLFLAALCVVLIDSPLSATGKQQSAFIAAPRVHQIGFTVTDLPRAIRFYRDTLGLPMMFETNGMAFFDLAGTRLMLGTDIERPPVTRPTAILYIDSIDFFATH